MPTIKDIAKEAGVSHGTVSNVLNKTGKVSTEKIRRVEEAMRKLGYVPNTQAQLLRQGTANAVAVILPTLQEDTYRDFYLALQQLLRQKGFRTELYLTNDISAVEEQILLNLPFSGLAAIVSVPSPGDRCGPLYGKISCPVIFANRSVDCSSGESTRIGFDFLSVGKRIGQYVLEHGWKHVAFLATAGNPADESEIYGGICAALADSTASVRKYTSDSYLVINRVFDLMSQDASFDGIITVGNVRADAFESARCFLGDKSDTDILCIGSAQIFPKAHRHMFELDYEAMAMETAEILIRRLRSQVSLPQKVVLPAKGFTFSFSDIAAPQKETLSMLMLESPTTTALAQLAPFLETTAGVHLKITAMSYDDLHAQVKIIRDSSCYDLVRMDTVWLDDLGRQLYLPLAQTGLLQRKEIRKVAESANPSFTRSGDVLCALPFDPSVQILLYRRDLFEDAVLQRAYYEMFREQLSVPKSIEQWRHVAQFFSRSSNPDSPTLYGATMTGGSPAIAVCDFLPYYLAAGGRMYDDSGKALLDTPEMRTALEQYASMKAFANPQGQLWWRESVRQFANGETATVLTFSNHASYIMNSQYANILQKTGAAMVPGGHPLLGGGVLGICRNTKKLGACQRFFDWFYSKDIASAIVRLGGASPIPEAYTSYENYSVFPWLETMGENFAIGTRGVGERYFSAFSMQDYELALGIAVYKMIHSGISSAEAAGMAQELYDQRTSARGSRA